MAPVTPPPQNPIFAPVPSLRGALSIRPSLLSVPLSAHHLFSASFLSSQYPRTSDKTSERSTKKQMH